MLPSWLNKIYARRCLIPLHYVRFLLSMPAHLPPFGMVSASESIVVGMSWNVA